MPSLQIRPRSIQVFTSGTILGVIVLACACVNHESAAETRQRNDQQQASIILECRWREAANRTIDIQFSDGVTLVSRFQPSEESISIQEAKAAYQPLNPGSVQLRTRNPSSRLWAELNCGVAGNGFMKVRIREGDRNLGEYRFRFFDLLLQKTELNLSGDSGTLTIRRKSGDNLRIFPLHEHLVFSANQTFQGVAIHNFGEAPERKSKPHLRWSIHRADSDETIQEGSKPFTLSRKNLSPILRQPFSLAVPPQEGAYELSVSLLNNQDEVLGTSIIPFVVHSGSEGGTGHREWQRGSRQTGTAIHDPVSFMKQIADGEVSDGKGDEITQWDTFLDFARELGDKGEKQNSNFVVLGVHFQGMCLYPSSSADENNTRFDNGLCSRDAPDPQRKDVLELVFREFDRRKILLIPEIDFTHPDSELERLLAVAGDEPCDIRSDSFAQSGEERAIYNPLSPQVQQRILEIVQELSNRYRHHPSFGGISLAIHDESWVSLAGADSGKDPITVQRFNEEVRSNLHSIQEDQPGGPGDRISPAIQREAEWLAWKSQKIAAFHNRLADTLATTDPRAKLYLSPHRLVASERFQRQALDAFHSGKPLESLFSMRGIEPRLIDRGSRIVLLRPFSLQVQPESDQALSVGLNTSQSLSQSFFPWHGTLAVSLVPPAASPTSSRREAPSEDQIVSFLIHSLAGMDSTCLVLDDFHGESHRTGSLKHLIKQLPAIPFTSLPNTQQPVTLKTASRDNQTWLLAVNDSSLSAKVTITLPESNPPDIRPMDNESAVELLTANEKSFWTWSLPPFSARACRVEAAQFEIATVETIPNIEDVKLLQERVDKLEKSLKGNHLRPHSERMVLPNADFESPVENGSLPGGWKYRYAKETPPRVDNNQPQEGEQSLVLENSASDSPTTIRSFPLSLPEIRNFTLSFWSRSQSERMPLTLRLSGKSKGQDWSQTRRTEAGVKWQRFVFRIVDLPPDLTDPEFSISVEQPGRVWLDSFEIYPHRISPEDERRITRAVASIRLAWQEQRYGDCERMLDGYWARFLNHVPPVTVHGEQPHPQLSTRYRDLIIR